MVSAQEFIDRVDREHDDCLMLYRGRPQGKPDNWAATMLVEPLVAAGLIRLEGGGDMPRTKWTHPINQGRPRADRRR